MGFISLWTYYDEAAFTSYMMVEGHKFDVFFVTSWAENLPVEAPGVLLSERDVVHDASRELFEQRVELREFVTLLFENILYTFKSDRPSNLGEITKIERIGDRENHCIAFAYEANDVVCEFVIFIR